jgi:hypothetical protein
MLTVIRRVAMILCAVYVLAGLASPAHAGPLPPCTVATLSANKRILVVNDLVYDDRDETHGRTPRTSTFHVLRRYVEKNNGLQLNGPDEYWANPLWSLVLEDGDKAPISCSYTLVTDDGEFLVLIGNDFGPPALSIYRRRDHPGAPPGGSGPDHGVLIRQITLTALWSPQHIPFQVTDHTPRWFANGTFAFSPDNRSLIHKTRWGQTLRIDLETGDVINL